MDRVKGKRVYDYLKVLLDFETEGKSVVKTLEIARKFSLHPSTVTEMLRKLSEKEYVEYVPYRGVKLTEKGRSIAKTVLRKHRLLEIFLIKMFGYDMDEACNEASSFDFLLSEKLADKICSFLNHPEVCPHGKPVFRSEKCCYAKIDADRKRTKNSNTIRVETS